MNEPDAARTRTYSWDDPMLLAQRAPEMSGLEFLRAMVAGELPRPPVGETLRFYPTEIEEGRVVFRFEPHEIHYNPMGVVHGGVVSTLLDTAMACSIHTTLPAGVGYTSVELKVNFLRPVTLAAGPLDCEGRLVHAGRRVGLADGRLRDAKGKLYAHGSTTCMILAPPG